MNIPQLISLFFSWETFWLVPVFMCESFSRGYSQKWAFSILGYEYLQLYSILPNLAKFYQKFSKVAFHFH